MRSESNDHYLKECQHNDNKKHITIKLIKHSSFQFISSSCKFANEILFDLFNDVHDFDAGKKKKCKRHQK